MLLSSGSSGLRSSRCCCYLPNKLATEVEVMEVGEDLDKVHIGQFERI
jgi:hypothetical protein